MSSVLSVMKSVSFFLEKRQYETKRSPILSRRELQLPREFQRASRRRAHKTEKFCRLRRVFGAARQFAKRKPARTYDDRPRKPANKTLKNLERQRVLSFCADQRTDKMGRADGRVPRQQNDSRNSVDKHGSV